MPLDSTQRAEGHEAAGRARVDRIAQRFYDVMEEREPALTLLHARDAAGKVDRGSRERFSLFLLGWLGGPGEYMARHGHPRLRMRHGRVPVDIAMRDAWLRCMDAALTECGVEGELRTFLDERFAHVANFLRNTEG
ncbi:MAG: cyanoglobin [Myxococcales bacterium]|nr:cyanoglobin [Myxococcales bacterium]